MDMYRQVLKVDSEHARAMVNLGNLHALRQEFAVAQGLYSQAADIDPGLALAHYNSHLTHLETFNMEAADDELRQARRIDDQLISGIMAGGTDSRTRRSPQDTTYSPREIWNRAAHLRLAGGVRQEVARAFTSTATMAGGAGLLAALLLPGIGLAPRAGAARRCRRCGRAFCRRCRVGTKYPDSCSQCIHLFILRDGLAPNVRDRKMADVIRYRRQVFLGTRIASLFLPGSGHVMGGRALLGTLLLATWATALFGIALRGRLLVSTGPNWAANRLGTLLPWLAVALAAWVIANLSRHEPSPD
jgi:tetratricopeptide (TPR) repeat protein